MASTMGDPKQGLMHCHVSILSFFYSTCSGTDYNPLSDALSILSFIWIFKYFEIWKTNFISLKFKYYNTK